tara:strand:+ start:94 stop:330 length:237 start_codon:yes stop_codon:yes gene_type:complete
MYIKVKTERKPKKIKRLRHRDIQFYGNTLSFKDFLQISKIVITNRAPGSFYRFFLPFVGIISTIMLGLGYIIGTHSIF